ncbi:MAG: two pore domain potassium channel family protein [Firmicutes bacterium]|nr:two pore domain potassium channel family protein [Bacillota bacterium]
MTNHTAFPYSLLTQSYVFDYTLILRNVSSFIVHHHWAMVSLTTMGYGDIYPVTTAGRVVTMVSSVFGIAVIALPSGIITAGFMEELDRKNKENDVKENADEKSKD